MKIFKAEKLETFSGEAIENISACFLPGIYQGFIEIRDEENKKSSIYNASDIKCLRNVTVEVVSHI